MKRWEEYVGPWMRSPVRGDLKVKVKYMNKRWRLYIRQRKILVKLGVEKYDITKPHKCPVCGQHEFPHGGSMLVCPVCDWMDDMYQEDFPDRGGCANNISLNEFKKYWADKHKGKCGEMKLKSKIDDGKKLTKGKIYNLLGSEELCGLTMYSLIDDEGLGPYLFASELFEIVTDETKEDMPERIKRYESEEERMRYCPYFGEKIFEGLCWEVVHCGRGWFKKSSCPEITDWDKAKQLCARCSHQCD